MSVWLGLLLATFAIANLGALMFMAASVHREVVAFGPLNGAGLACFYIGLLCLLNAVVFGAAGI